MNPYVAAGVVLVVLALVIYTVAVAAEQRRRVVTRRVLGVFAAGIVFDVAATACMALAAGHLPFTVHGFVGYTSLAGMLTAVWLLWRFAAAHPEGARVPDGVHLFVRGAYVWWVAAFITGALLGLRR